MEHIILAFEVLAYAALVLFAGVLNSKYYERKKIPFVDKIIAMQVVVAIFVVSVSWTLSGFWSTLFHILWHVLLIVGIVGGAYYLPKLRLQYVTQKRAAWLMIYLSASFEIIGLLFYAFRLF